MKTVAVVPARGIGDALLMMIAAHQFSRAGHSVTLYHTSLCELASWFPESAIRSEREHPFTQDLIIAENDNSDRIKDLLRIHRSQLALFYLSYKSSKHAPLAPMDYVFDPLRPVADNIAFAAARLLDCVPSKDNGIRPPGGLSYRKQRARVIIHPTSSSADKNWGLERYKELGKRLSAEGFEPLFVVSESERSLDLPSLTVAPTLTDLATLVYESGYAIGNDSLLGHLASNLNIPTLILAQNKRHMQLWRPGWRPGNVLCPPPWIPKTYWRQGITPRRACREFKTLADSL
jgi:heptosyltransferase-3